MPTPRKSRAQLAEEAYEQQARAIESAGQNAADALSAAGQQYTDDLNAANQARQDAYNAAQQSYRQRMDQGYTDFADIVAGERLRADQAEREALAQRDAERKAARWTGAAELASSIANMVGVGSMNAVSQQYKPYSQDWMRRADENWRVNRARFDNLRERQRALGQQLIQLKAGDAGQALAMANRQADAAYQGGAGLAQQRYANATGVANARTQAAEKAGQLRTQGAVQAANIGLHEQQLAQSAAQHAAQLKETQRYHDEQIKIQQAKAAKGSGSGKSGLNNYDITVDGKRYTVSMNDTTFKTAVRNGKTDLKKDIAKMAGAANWDEFRRLVSSDKATRDKYYNILSAIEQGGDENDRVIEDFISENRDELNEFNSHIMRVANSGYGTGTVRSEQSSPSGTSSPAPASDGDFDFDDTPQAEQGGKGTEYDKRKKDETGLGGYR